MKKTNTTMNFKKKTFVKPQMKAYQVQSEAIMVGSEDASKKNSAKTEEYETGNTTNWFNV